MAFSPIAFTIPEYDRSLFANYWLKAYEPGTTTPKPMSIDSAGSSQASRFELNSQGFPVTSGSAFVIPHIEGNYDLWLFPTDAEADANDTSNALQFADDISTTGGAVATLTNEYFDTVALMVASTAPIIGNIISTKGYYTPGDEGGANYLVSSAQVVDEFGSHTLANGNVALLQAGGVIHANQFGAIGDGSLGAAPAQEGQGTGTDDSAAIQAALNVIKAEGGKLEFQGDKVYLCDSALSLLRDTDNGPTQYNIEFNGAALDFSNLASGNYLHVGATSLANIATDVGHIRLGNGRIFGQQTGNPGAGSAPTNTATTGIKLEFAYNTLLDHMVVTRCYKGVETHYSFPILDLMGSYQRNVIGLYMDDVTNDSTWIRTEAPQCRFGLVTAPQGLSDAGKMVNNNFIGFRAEGCQVGVQLDPKSNNAGQGVLRDWSFDSPYFSNNEYDTFRAGLRVDLNDASVRGPNSNDRVYGLRIRGGQWGLTPSPTQGALVFGSNVNVRQVEIDIPVDITIAGTLVGSVRWGHIISTTQPDSSSDTYFDVYYGDLGQVVGGTIQETVTGTTDLITAALSVMDGTVSAVTATLPDGSRMGQQKRIGMVGGSTSTVTITKHITSSPEVFTFNGPSDYLSLEWDGNVWNTLINNGVAT